jgi:RimJ/RimL family protein N-acetyltransferase
MNVFNLRIATLQDAEITYNWANDPIIRQFSFSKDKIEWHNHKEWFQNKINSEKCLYLILEEGTLPVGSIRFDINQDCCGVISYLVVPSFHGRGLGEFLLMNGIDKLIELIPNIHAVAGTVFKENKASIRIFEKSGFQIVSADQLSIKYIKKI